MQDSKLDTGRVSDETVVSSFRAVQLQQALETYRAQWVLAVQMVSVVALANLTLAGYGVSSKAAGAVMICAIFPLLIITILRRANQLMIPIIYAAISVEAKVGGPTDDWLMTTYVGFARSDGYLAKMKEVASIEDEGERLRQLRELSLPRMGEGRGLVRIALIAFSIVQVAAPVYWLLVSGWQIL